MDMRILHDSLAKLRQYIENEGYSGYDPYDTLNSRLEGILIGKWLPIAAIQFQKRNPFNIRPLLGVHKEINPKTMGLCLNAYSRLYEQSTRKDCLDSMNSIVQWLAENAAEKRSHFCWGYNFPWASPEKTTPRHAPNIVVTATIAKGLFRFWLSTGSPQAKEMLKGVAEFILRDLPFSEDRTGVCFSYTTLAKDCCYNASLLGAEALAKLHSINPDAELAKKSIQALDFVVSRQKSDGSWNYSVDLATGQERKQVDFHQGYILESISELLKYLNISDRKYILALRKGLEFYHHRQFYPNGRSWWRLPREFPVDIHNQAQGIVTFTVCKGMAEPFLSFAETIAEWTMRNMQDPKGYFYYRCNRLFKNKIPYMRWSQAWMFLALVMLLRTKEQ